MRVSRPVLADHEVLAAVDPLPSEVEVPAWVAVSISSLNTQARASAKGGKGETSPGGHQRGAPSRSTSASTASLRRRQRSYCATASAPEATGTFQPSWIKPMHPVSPPRIAPTQKL